MKEPVPVPEAAAQAPVQGAAAQALVQGVAVRARVPGVAMEAVLAPAPGRVGEMGRVMVQARARVMASMSEEALAEARRGLRNDRCQAMDRPDRALVAGRAVQA